MIDYATFLAQAQTADVSALNFIAMNQVVKTQNSTDADAIQAQGIRLFNAGLLTRFTRAIERVGADEVWHVFDGRIDPVASTYLAQAAAERLVLSRSPLPPA